MAYLYTDLVHSMYGSPRSSDGSERWTFNPMVAGSSPVGGIRHFEGSSPVRGFCVFGGVTVFNSTFKDSSAVTKSCNSRL